MHIHRYTDLQSLAIAASAHIATAATAAMAARGRFSLVLSGGSTPKPVYEALAQDPYRKAIDWTRVDFFFGDERCVPPSNEASNYRMACEALLKHIDLSPENVYRIQGELPPAEAASAYQLALKQYFAGREARFDLVLLGLGDDAHTASLFPHTSGIHEQEAWVKAVYVEKLGADRITLTPPVLNAARAVSFLVTGSSKAPALREIMQGDYAPDQYPAQIIKPQSGTLNWYLDQAAAQGLA